MKILGTYKYRKKYVKNTYKYLISFPYKYLHNRQIKHIH